MIVNLTVSRVYSNRAFRYFCKKNRKSFVYGWEFYYGRKYGHIFSYRHEVLSKGVNENYYNFIVATPTYSVGRA